MYSPIIIIVICHLAEICVKILEKEAILINSLFRNFNIDVSVT